MLRVGEIKKLASWWRPALIAFCVGNAHFAELSKLKKKLSIHNWNMEVERSWMAKWALIILDGLSGLSNLIFRPRTANLHSKNYQIQTVSTKLSLLWCRRLEICFSALPWPEHTTDWKCVIIAFYHHDRHLRIYFLIEWHRELWESWFGCIWKSKVTFFEKKFEIISDRRSKPQKGGARFNFSCKRGIYA